MRKWVVVLVAVALLSPVVALAQHSSKAAEGKVATSNFRVKATTLLGQISLDGKSLVSEENVIWTVNNPDVLAGHEGQHVSVRCQLDALKNQIHVLTFKLALLEVKAASNKSDSAFRR